MRLLANYESIASMKLFSWYKDSALPIAFGLSLRSSKDAYATAAISMATSLELILQAQQAIMISTIAATSVQQHQILAQIDEHVILNINYLDKRSKK